MKAKIVRIGTSQGIRIPKPLIEQTGPGQDVEILVEGSRLILGPAGRPRAGWAAAFQEMARSGDDHLAQGDEHIPTKWEGEDIRRIVEAVLEGRTNEEALIRKNREHLTRYHTTQARAAYLLERLKYGNDLLFAADLYP